MNELRNLTILKTMNFKPLWISVWTIVLALLTANSCMAQEVQTLSLTHRNGNIYIVENQTMNRYAYSQYLSQTCPQAYSQFSKGMTLSHIGWGLFGGGLAFTTSAIAMGLARPVKDEVLPYHHAMNALFWTGNAIVTAGIPLLIVGYVKQHNAAKTYNDFVGQPPYVSLNISGHGLGLAYNF